MNRSQRISRTGASMFNVTDANVHPTTTVPSGMLTGDGVTAAPGARKSLLCPFPLLLRVGVVRVLICPIDLRVEAHIQRATGRWNPLHALALTGYCCPIDVCGTHARRSHLQLVRRNLRSRRPGEQDRRASKRTAGCGGSHGCGCCRALLRIGVVVVLPCS